MMAERNVLQIFGSTRLLLFARYAGSNRVIWESIGPARYISSYIHTHIYEVYVICTRYMYSEYNIWYNFRLDSMCDVLPVLVGFVAINTFVFFCTCVLARVLLLITLFRFLAIWAHKPELARRHKPGTLSYSNKQSTAVCVCVCNRPTRPAWSSSSRNGRTRWWWGLRSSWRTSRS